jgi:hypothetical protein
MGIGVAMKLHSIRKKLFGSPHITDAVIYLVLLLIITHASALLMNQPLSYWQNPDLVEPNLELDFLLRRGAVLFGTGTVFYLLGVAVLLKRLNHQAGIFLSSMLLVFHSFLLYRVTPGGLIPILTFATRTGRCIFQYGLPTIFFLLYFCVLMFTLPDRFGRLARRAALFASVGWIVFLGVGLMRVISPPESAWRVITSASSPGNRVYAAVAYDTKRQRAILFGGKSYWKIGGQEEYESSTWEWDGQDWHEVTPLVSPPGRVNHEMIYDEERGEVLMYSGQNQNGILTDLWAWDGENWRQLCPVCNPEGRIFHKMFYDFEKKAVFLYGGYGDGPDRGYGEGGNIEELWSWNGTCWTNFPVSTSAPLLGNSPIVYDNFNHRAIAYISVPDWGGVWFLEGDAWRHLPLQIQPEFRVNATMVYDPENQKSIFFGGYNDSTWYKDTWIFNGTSWTELKTPISPSRRTGSVAFYDPLRQSMILYGGENNMMVLGDMWELDLPKGDN